MCETRKTPNDLPLDAVAQALGLDIFNYELPDVLGMIACLQESEQIAAEREKKLLDFKTYVHNRLDTAGIDKHEEQNAINGCRIGARLDDVLAAAPAGVLSVGDLMNRLVKLAKAYRPSAQDSIQRNSHMHDLALGEGEVIDQATIDAVLTNFLNQVGVAHCLDLGLYSSDLASQETEVRHAA
jgi:hypothetical protein